MRSWYEQCDDNLLFRIGLSQICELLLSLDYGPTNSEVNSTGATLVRVFNASLIVKVEFFTGIPYPSDVLDLFLPSTVIAF